MRLRLSAMTIGLFSSSLAACASGGGGSPPTVIPVGNSSFQGYLPLSNGNGWSFSSGARISDTGTMALQCNCAYSGGKIEGHDLFGASGSYSGTFYYAKAAGLQGSGATITYLVGISSDHGTTVDLAGSTSTSRGTIPGLSVMDDQPTTNETFTDPSGDTSTIGAVNQTVTYSGTTYVDDTIDTISGSNFSSTSFGYARGVGYTSIRYQGQSTTLVSFSINTATSYAFARPLGVVHATSIASQAQIERMLGTLTKPAL